MTARAALVVLVAVMAVLPAAARAAVGETLAQQNSEKAQFRVVTVAEGLERPWGMSFLPDSRILVTERPGRLRLIGRNGRLSAPIANVPKVLARGQGGLLDVVISPAFERDRTIFLSYAEPTANGGRTAVARAILDEETLRDVKVIFRQAQDPTGGNHWGSRLVFAPDGSLFVTLGDRFNYRDQAQQLGSHLGKIVRVRPDGTVPADNPFVGVADAQPEIWSFGHRNVQGATLNPATGRLWTSEHGAQGRRRDQYPGSRPQLRVAGDHPRRGLFRRADRDRQRQAPGWSSRSGSGHRQLRRQDWRSIPGPPSRLGAATCLRARSRTGCWSAWNWKVIG